MKRLVSGLVVGSTLLLVTPAVAHGVGGRQDLPFPLAYFIAGAAVVLILSFMVLAVNWYEPRLQAGPDYLSSRFTQAGRGARSLRPVGLAGFLIVIVGGFVGDGFAPPFIVWIGLWLFLPFLSMLVGDIYTLLNPWRTMAMALRLPRMKRRNPLGMWPAVAAFFGMVWLELIADTGGEARTLAIAALLYTVWLFGWMLIFGMDEGLQTADVFTVFNRYVSAIAPYGRHHDGGLMWRGWFRALVVLPIRRGSAPFAIAMIGTVTYDGLSSSTAWQEWFGDEVLDVGFQTLALLATSAAVGVAYYLAIFVAVRQAGSDTHARMTAASFAHTLIPIGVAYAFAHYVTLVLFEGQALIGVLSDPLGLGWNLFGTAGFSINYSWLSPTGIWWIQLLTILIGHVVSIALAHDRSLVEFPSDTAVRSQYTMLGLMVLLTSLGLFLLAG